MRKISVLLLLLPVAVHAQHAVSRTFSFGTSTALPLGLVVGSEYEWKLSDILGLSGGATYSLRTVGRKSASDCTFARLASLDLSIGGSMHAFNATHLHPYIAFGAELFYGIELAQLDHNDTQVDLVFPMLYIGGGLLQPIDSVSAVGLGARIEVSPLSRDQTVNALIIALQWQTAM